MAAGLRRRPGRLREFTGDPNNRPVQPLNERPIRLLGG